MHALLTAETIEEFQTKGVTVIRGLFAVTSIRSETASPATWQSRGPMPPKT